LRNARAKCSWLASHPDSEADYSFQMLGSGPTKPLAFVFSSRLLRGDLKAALRCPIYPNYGCAGRSCIAAPQESALRSLVTDHEVGIADADSKIGRKTARNERQSHDVRQCLDRPGSICSFHYSPHAM